jgi:hypothetical protein
MQNNPTNIELVKRIIIDNINSNDIEKLESVLKLTDDITVPDELLFKTHIYCGNYYFENNEIFKALNHFSNAKSLSPTNLEVIIKCLQALTIFYNENKDAFSKNDLNKLSQVLDNLHHACIINFPNESEVDLQISKLKDTIDFQSKYIAGDVIETKMTFWVGQIYSSFTEPNTYQEVLENFATAIEDDLRIFYDEEIKLSNNENSLDNGDSKTEDSEDSDKDKQE